MAKPSKEELRERWAASGQRTIVVQGAQTVARALPAIKWDGELTNSARSTFLHCPKKFEYQYLRRMSPRRPSIPFLVGGLFHNGLERLYTTWQFDEDEERKIAEEACEAACAEPSITDAESDKIWSQQAMVMGMLRGYVKEYMKADKRDWRVIKAEESFVYPLPPALYLPALGGVRRTSRARGKRDMVVQRRKDGALGLVEHKTAGRLDHGYIAKLPLDNQILGYVNSMLKQYKRLPKFITYNVAKKSGLRQGVRESFKEFQRRIESEYIGATSLYFYRETLTFTGAAVQAYENELHKFVSNLDRAIKEGYFMQNTTHCTAMGVCPYMPLCTQGATGDTLGRYRVRENTHEELDNTTEVMD